MVKRRNFLTPLVVGILMVLNQILSYSVVNPDIAAQPHRYVLYWMLVVVTNVGPNLLVLYLAYFLEEKYNTVDRLKSVLGIFIFTQIVSVFVSILLIQKFSLNDILALIFPLSRGSFPLDSSLLLIFVLGPQINGYIKKLSKKNQNALLIFIMWFLMVMPLIFGKSLWGISSVADPIWLFGVFIIGCVLKNRELFQRFGVLKSLVCFVVVMSFVGLLLVVNPVHMSALNIQSRVLTGYNLISFTLAFLVGTLSYSVGRIIKNQFHDRLQHINNYLLSVILVFLYSPTTENLLNDRLKVPADISFIDLVGKVGKIFVFFLLLSMVMTTIVLVVKYLNTKKHFLTFSSVYEFKSLSNIKLYMCNIVLNNSKLIFTFITAYIFAILQFITARTVSAKISISLIKVIFDNSYAEIFLTALIIFAIFILIYMIINRFWYAYFLAVALVTFISISEILKLKLREEPILPADLKMISSAKEIINMINPVIIIFIIFFILILGVLSFVLQKHFDKIYHVKTIYQRAFVIMVILLTFSGGFFVNHKNSFSRIVLNAFNVNQLFWDQDTGAILNGPILQFVNNLDVKVMDKPSGYNKQHIKQIMDKYDKISMKVNEDRSGNLKGKTVIFILSESFSDPNRVPNLKVTPNPMPVIDSIKKKTTSGLMMSSGYGGGTANMEWQSLTGLSVSNLSPTLATPYTQLVSQQQKTPSFVDIFDESQAIHPYTANLYARKSVFKKMGFDRFYYLGSKYKIRYQMKLGKSPYISDDSAYKQTLKTISKSHSSQFIQLSTMQNHMPFDNYYKNNTFKVSGTAYDKGDKSSIKTYSKGLNYTDHAVGNFIKKVNKIKRPVTVVWYGDHLASLYNKDSMKKYGIQLHQTDYFIYNNKSRKILKNSSVVSPYAFPALALKTMGVKVTPYYALIDKVSSDLPAMTIDPVQSESNSINGSSVFVNSKGKKVKYSDLSQHQRDVLRDYRLIQYDLTAGKQYSAKWAEQKSTR